jgi:hypothetical protein
MQDYKKAEGLILELKIGPRYECRRGLFPGGGIKKEIYRACLTVNIYS